MWKEVVIKKTTISRILVGSSLAEYLAEKLNDIEKKEGKDIERVVIVHHDDKLLEVVVRISE